MSVAAASPFRRTGASRKWYLRTTGRYRYKTCAMKVCLAIGLLCLAMAPLGCGESESATSASRTDTSQSKQAKPEEEPDPKKLVIEDLKTGSGAEAHWGDHLEVLYIGTFLDTGEEFVRR